MARGGVRGLAGKLGLTVGSVVLTLLAVEGAMRLLPSSPRFLRAEEIWRAQQIEPGAALFADGFELGGITFRDDPLPEAAFAPEATRLLFLGDSFTVGWGLAAREQRFSDRVEQALRESDVPALHVFNAARGGSNPEQWAGHLGRVWPHVRPHAVVAVFFLRDGTRLGTSLQLNRKEIRPIRERALARPLYGR